MPVRFVVGNEYYSEASSLERTLQFRDDFARYLAGFDDGRTKFEVSDTDHGIGADWMTVTVAVGGLLLFGVPEAHKRIREAAAEWKIIRSRLVELFAYVQRKRRVHLYSIEVAFLEALAFLDNLTDAADLELLQATQVAGVMGSKIGDEMERASVLYYMFVFRDPKDRSVHILIYDSALSQIQHTSLPLDPRFPRDGGMNMRLSK